MKIQMKKADYDLYTAGFQCGKQDIANDELRGSSVLMQALGIEDGTNESTWFAIGYYDATIGKQPMNQRPELQLDF